MKYSKITKYKYRLEADEWFQTRQRPKSDIKTDEIWLFTDGRMCVLKGYLYDGPSGPTFDRKTNMRGSLGHDAESELARQGFLTQEDKKLANLDLIDWCIEDGMWRWWAKNVYGLGVSLTNNWWRQTNKPEHPILTAP